MEENRKETVIASHSIDSESNPIVSNDWISPEMIAVLAGEQVVFNMNLDSEENEPDNS